jgi:hypothetical protein
MQLHETKSPSLRFLNKVYVVEGLMFLAHNKDVELGLLDQHQQQKSTMKPWSS